MKTEFGKIAELVQEAEEKETPLQRKLNNLKEEDQQNVDEKECEYTRETVGEKYNGTYLKMRCKRIDKKKEVVLFL